VDNQGDILELEWLAKIANHDTAAINALLESLNTKMRPFFLDKGLSDQDIDELLMDALSIFLYKLQNQEYVYKGYPMIVYLIKIAKLRLNYYLKRIEKANILKDYLKNQLVSDLDENDDIANWEKVLKAMSLLREEEKKLIDLYYLQGYKDREIYEKNLLPYASAESVKSQRHKAMKKLIEKVNQLEGN
jgi:DNA-directed RNA polymerase specialized sigma24 family protein